RCAPERSRASTWPRPAATWRWWRRSTGRWGAVPDDESIQPRGPTLDLLIAVVVGLIAGAHVSTWGMYKDAIHEGFTWPKYFRSIVLGALVGAVLQAVLGMDLSRAGGVVVFFGLVYAVERLLLELWKSFIREEDQ